MGKANTERDEARADLRKTLKPGDTVYTILRHVSKSGMSRLIDVQAIEDNEPRWLSRWVSRATGITFDEKREALRVGGCGMDMGFHVVYELSHALYPDGFECIGNRCPSNDHSNGDRDYTPHDRGDIRWTPGSKYRAPHHHTHKDGGYALRHRWM